MSGGPDADKICGLERFRAGGGRVLPRETAGGAALRRGFFGVMGLGVHGFLVVRNPEGYVGFAEQALIRWYRQIGLFLTAPNPRAFGIVMLIFEVTLAALILSRGRWVKVGIVGAILFLVGISPLGFDIMPNLLLAAALVYLLTQDFPRDALTMLRDRHRRGTATRATNREPQGHNSFRS